MEDNNLDFSFTSYEIVNKNDIRIGFREAWRLDLNLLTSAPKVP